MRAVEKNLILAVIYFIAWIPTFLWQILVWPVLKLAPIFAKRKFRHFDRNLDLVYNLPAHSEFSLMFKRQVLRHQLLCFRETLQILLRGARPELRGFEELRRHIEAAEKEGKGHLIVTAHMGSWELVAKYGAEAAREPFRVLAKPSRRTAATEVLNILREKMNVQVLWTDKKSLVRDMLGTLRAGGSVGFVMDQKPEGRKGEVVPFFAQETAFVSGPATMAIKTGAAVISVFVVRTGPMQYRIVSNTLFPANHGCDDPNQMTAAMAAEIERWIRFYPDQWTWTYKRWRSTSDLDAASTVNP